MSTLNVNDYLPITLTDWEASLGLTQYVIAKHIQHGHLDSSGMFHTPDISNGPAASSAAARRVLNQYFAEYVGKDMRGLHVYA